jgi:hypothetical protein
VGQLELLHGSQGAPDSQAPEFPAEVEQGFPVPSQPPSLQGVHSLVSDSGHSLHGVQQEDMVGYNWLTDGQRDKQTDRQTDGPQAVVG